MFLQFRTHNFNFYLQEVSIYCLTRQKKNKEDKYITMVSSHPITYNLSLNVYRVIMKKLEGSSRSWCIQQYSTGQQ